MPGLRASARLCFGGLRVRGQYHLAQRVVIDEQWAPGTTLADYFADITRAVHSPVADVAVYERRGGSIAITVVDTEAVLPLERRGPRSARHLLVVYSADRAIIVSAYQFSAFGVTGIPEDALWLKRRS